MSKQIFLQYVRFFLVCLALGVLCEQCFFHDQLGLSFLIFVVIFYTVFLWHFRKSAFQHQRFAMLIMACIGVLSATYLFYDNLLFYLLNIMVIPGLVVCHCVLLLSPKEIEWHRGRFVTYVFLKVKRIFTVNFRCLSLFNKVIGKRVNEKNYDVIKKITIGVVISLPVLVIVLALLSSADAVFGELVSGLPNWFAHLKIGDLIPRLIVILMTSLIFFGFFIGLHQKERLREKIAFPEKQGDKIIVITVLSLINAVYLLFTIVQFRYFFGGELVDGLTYAEYARHGFMQLILVTMINLTILITVINVMENFVKSIQTLLSLLVAFSGVMLWSAFERLLLYEEAYGFTVLRMLAHAFMLFLIIIFAYTLIKIWIRRLSLVHFYVTSTLVFYTALNLVHIDQWVVKENLHRYEQTNKIDIHYLNRLSYTGVLGLIDLYEKHPNIPGLEDTLRLRKSEVENEHMTWRSYNLAEARGHERLENLNLNK